MWENIALSDLFLLHFENENLVCSNQIRMHSILSQYIYPSIHIKRYKYLILSHYIFPSYFNTLFYLIWVSTSTLSYLNTPILLYRNTSILSYFNTPIQSYLNTSILPYLNTSVLPYLNTIHPILISIHLS